MTTRRTRSYFPAVLAGGLLFSASGILSISHAEVTADTSPQGNLGTGVTAGPNFDITGGTRPGGGSNLFHGFDSFSLTSSETANFINDSGLATKNILSRVTGGNPSNIYGTIQTTDFPGANLYLMNPAGFLFGPTAQLKVEGSFHVTTADYMKLGNDGIFYADVAQGSVLNVSSPSAFGFLDANPGSIEVHTGGIDFDTYLPTALLEVPEGETLSLVGGPIDLGTPDFSTSGFLLAPAGTVNLVSVASPGEVTLDDPINADGFAQLGDINISGGSIVDAKNIYIRGGNLVIDESVLVPGGFAYELSFVGLSPLPDGGEVNVKVTDNLTMTGTDLEILTLAAPGIFVYTGDFLDISPAAKVPDVNIDAGSVSISGVAGISVTRNAPGENGNVVINANDVTVEKGGSIVLINTYEGDDPTAPGPSLAINAQTVDVSGDGSDSAYGFEGIAAQGLVNLTYLDTQFGADVITANSGDINITATDSLSVTGLGQITTDSRIFGSAGDITINTGDLLVAGTGDANSAFIGSQSALAGDSGDIVINTTGGITVKDGGRISSASLGSGDAGDVTLTAAGPITLEGADARIVGATFQPSDNVLNDLFLEVFFWYDFNTIQDEMGDPDASLMEVLAYLSDIGDINIPDLDLIPGDGGAITIATPTLTANAGTRIETSTGWEGNAGSVTANVGALFVNDGATIRSRSGVEFLDGTGHVGPGDGGAVNINAADTISISGMGSTISTSTFGDGNGGTITINGNKVEISNGGIVSADSGGTLGGEFLSGSGLAGDIAITTGTDIVMDDGTISTSTFGEGDGGSIVVNVDSLSLDNGASISSRSGGLLDGSLVAGTGNGGLINVTATDTITISGSSPTTGDGSFISTSTFGDGDGGDISLNAGHKVKISNGGVVSADSLAQVGEGTGLAGDIAINAGNEIKLSNGTISTQAVTSDGGNIALTAKERVYLLNSEITTSVESGFGGGGNIDIDPKFVILNQSKILANAFGGPGGNINIVAGNFIVSPDSVIDASSELGVDGTVNISSPDEEVAEDLAVLSDSYLDVTGLVSERCGTTAGASSLVDAGPGGLAVDPDGYLPSFATATNQKYAATGGSRSVRSGERWWGPDADQAALQIAQLTCTN